MDKQKIKKIAGTVLNVLVWIFVVLSVLVTMLVLTAQGSEDGVPSVFGKSFITISTASMEDTYSRGDLVIMTKLTDDEKFDLEVGDIITFRTSIDIDGDGKSGDLNTHRIYSMEEGSLTLVTKGDNNPAPDNTGDNPYTVHHSDIIGKCEEDGVLRGVGSVINFLRSSLGFFLCIVLPLILFFLYELYNFISILVSERAKKAPAVSAAISKEEEEEIRRRAIEEYIKSQEAKANGNAEENDGE